jgi:hypothetical protein
MTSTTRSCISRPRPRNSLITRCRGFGGPLAYPRWRSRRITPFDSAPSLPRTSWPSTSTRRGTQQLPRQYPDCGRSQEDEHPECGTPNGKRFELNSQSRLRKGSQPCGRSGLVRPLASRRLRVFSRMTSPIIVRGTPRNLFGRRGACLRSTVNNNS